MQFQKGQSGNPNGRPRGSRNQSTLLAALLNHTQSEEVLAWIVEMAKAGNPAAMRLCMNRLAPRRRGYPVDFELPPLTTAGDVKTAIAAISAGFGNGSLTPSEAMELARSVESFARSLIAADLAAYLDRPGKANRTRATPLQSPANARSPASRPACATGSRTRRPRARASASAETAP